MRIYHVNGTIPLIIIYEVLLEYLRHKTKVDPTVLLSKLIKEASEYRAYYFSYGRSAVSALIRKICRLGDQIILPAFISPSLADAVIRSGIRPIFVDVDIDNFNVSTDLLLEKLASNPNVKAVLVVHTFGVPAQIAEIREITEDFGVYLIEDVAQALLAKYKGTYVGNFGDFILVSMYKQIPNIHGAILFSKVEIDEPQITDVLTFSDLLRLICRIRGPHQYIVHTIRKVRKPIEEQVYTKEERKPLSLSVLIFKRMFKKLAQSRDTMNAIAASYIESLDGNNFFIPQRVSGESVRSWFNFSVRLKPEFSDLRDPLLMSLRRDGIFCDRQWYDAPVVQEQFRRRLKIKDRYANTELLSKTVINLPIHVEYSSNDAKYIVNKLGDKVESLAYC